MLAGAEESDSETPLPTKLFPIGTTLFPIITLVCPTCTPHLESLSVKFSSAKKEKALPFSWNSSVLSLRYEMLIPVDVFFVVNPNNIFVV